MSTQPSPAKPSLPGRLNDRLVYESRIAGSTYLQLARRFSVSISAVRKAASRYAHREGLPMPKTRVDLRRRGDAISDAEVAVLLARWRGED